MNNTKKSRAIISDKPYPVSIEMRPLWRISLIVISILTVVGRNECLNIKKLNILVWMLIRKHKWQEYEDYLYDRTKRIPFISIDTATYKAVEFSIAKELIILEGGKVKATDQGECLFELIVEDGILLEEIEFLKGIGKKLTDNKVKNITGG